MQLGSFEPLGDKPVDKCLNGAVVCFGNAIQADKSASLYDYRVSNDFGILRFFLKQISSVEDLARRNRLWKGIHHGDPLTCLSLRFCFAGFANRCFNGIGASGDFDIVHLRARDRKHERRGVSKVALKGDGASTLRQLRI